MESSTVSLKKIDSLLIDFDQALLVNYPVMKLGVVAGVEFYIEKLAVLARSVMQEHLDCKDWVLTAPPFIAAPAAANLLCWCLYDVLADQLPPSYSLSMIDLHYKNLPTGVEDDQDFKLCYEYSNNSVEDRVKERSRMQDDIGLHADAFEGKGVLIVNDIKVTGTQQDFLTSSFAAVSPARLHWVYILEVDRSLASEHPEVEHQINNSNIKSLDEYKQVIQLSDTHYTARCLSRLFNYQIDEFRSLLNALDSAQLSTILGYALGERRFEGAYFSEKLELLKDFCTTTNTAAIKYDNNPNRAVRST